MTLIPFNSEYNITIKYHIKPDVTYGGNTFTQALRIVDVEKKYNYNPTGSLGKSITSLNSIIMRKTSIVAINDRVNCHIREINVIYIHPFPTETFSGGWQ